MGVDDSSALIQRGAYTHRDDWEADQLNAIMKDVGVTNLWDLYKNLFNSGNKGVFSFKKLEGAAKQSKKEAAKQSKKEEEEKEKARARASALAEEAEKKEEEEEEEKTSS